ncbi:hypothetical protein EMPS_01769 [Entomortierella parvispora]|uniref:F-box domain-containing protein n=1 Tax=Entomortierella parvispora TaxID=205924 RepID=A0A9P3H3I7_9FUNG|nr:hypothetical protein EMPS_01769 [Entomortierella parvispora]
MLHALRQHQTLSTLLLDFPHGLDWPGVRAALHSLPDTIERLAINGSSQWALLHAAQPLEALVRIEPYLRLRQLHFGKEFGKIQLLTGLLPFLQLCPRLQEFRLDLTRLSPSLEKIIADKLLEYCPDINNLDLRFWETNEQMRLIQGYAFKTLRVCDFILRDPASIGRVPPRGPSTTFRPSDDRPRTIPFLALSKDTLEVLELESTHCWIPYHDLDLVLNQFPNLKELTMDLFDFRPQDRGHQHPTTGSMATKIEKLTLVIHEHPTAQQNQDAIDFCSMVLLPPLLEEEVEDDGEDYDRRDEWSFRDLFGVLELDVPPTTRQSSVTLAGDILRLYDRLALFKHLQDVQLIWYIYRALDAVWDFDGNLDVRGPLQIELERQGLSRAALQKMNLKWTEYPAHDEDKAQEVDAKLKAQGFVLTDMEAGPRRNRVYGEHVRALRRSMTRVTKSADTEHESDDDGGETEIACRLYKSRNRRRTELARRFRSQHLK